MSDDPSKCANYLRIIRLLVVVGTEKLRNLLYKLIRKSDIAGFLKSKKQALLELRRKHVLSSEEFKTVTNHSNADEFDISLIIKLLTNFFPWEKEAPKNGWGKVVHDSDESLGADIMRLRKLRDTLVAHRPDARLSLEEFETSWEQAEKSLIRIAAKTGVEKVEDVILEIKEYKSRPLDDEEMCITSVEKWRQEDAILLFGLQVQLEECKRMEDFSPFFKDKLPDRYYRYILLLQEVGSFVLKKILEMEQKTVQGDLSKLLRKHQKQIDFQEIFKESNTIETNTSTWGTKVLADVTLVLFDKSLSSIQKKTIARLIDKFNGLQKAAHASLDSDTFRPYWTDIVTIIQKLVAGLDNEDTQEECDRLVEQYDTKPIDEDAATKCFEQLRKYLQPTDMLILYKEAKDKLKGIVELIQNIGSCDATIVVELKMITHGSSKEMEELAGKKLKVFFENLENNNLQTNIAVNAILKLIEDLPGVRLVSVEKGSVLLILQCLDLDGLIQLLDVVDTAAFFSCVTDISIGLSNYFAEEIGVTAFFTLESIHNAMAIISNRGEPNKNTSSISLKLQCSNIEALDGLKSMMKTNEITDNVNAVAQSISEILDEEVSVHTSLEIDRMKVVVSDPYLSSDEGTTVLPRPQSQTETKMQQKVAEKVYSLSSDLAKVSCNEKSKVKDIRKSVSDIEPDAQVFNCGDIARKNSFNGVPQKVFHKPGVRCQ